MEKLETSDAAMVPRSIRLPIQLPLSWGDASGNPAVGEQPPVSASPGTEVDHDSPLSRTEARRVQLIEAGTRRFKLACVSLLGILLFSLNYFGS